MKTEQEKEIKAQTKPHLPHILCFLGMTFGLSWLVDLVICLNGGLANPATPLLLQFQMLLPAFSAIILGVFFFKESPLYRYTNRGITRWFVYFYIFLTFLYLIGSIIALIQTNLAGTIAAVLLVPNVLGLLLLVVLRLIGGSNEFSRAGLSGGKPRFWLFMGIGLILYYGFQTFLNYLFKMGHLIDLSAAFPQMATANLPRAAWLPVMALNSVVIGPFLGLIIAFGEEYGWRGYLQTELIHLGRIRGVLILGIIWGVWHWPIIWMGYNFPGHSVLGSLAMVSIGIIFAFFFAYAVFKSKGMWIAAYLHALNNQALSFFFMALVAPADNLFSFGAGFPGIALGAIAVFLILRDPVWRTDRIEFLKE